MSAEPRELLRCWPSLSLCVLILALCNCQHTSQLGGKVFIMACRGVKSFLLAHKFLKFFLCCLQSLWMKGESCIATGALLPVGPVKKAGKDALK